MTLALLRPGLLAYDEALRLQHDLRDRVLSSGGRAAFLVLTEHTPTITLGRNARAENLLVPELELAARGCAVRRVDRGGDVTYHGPGQLVGYPIFALRAFGLALRGYLCALERSLLDVLAGFGVAAARRPRTAGLWVGERKIVSIGLRVARGVTTHGFAFNVANDLAPFSWIHPCGLRGQEMTSLARETGRPWTLEDVGDRFHAAFRSRLSFRFCTARVPSPLEGEHS